MKKDSVCLWVKFVPFKGYFQVYPTFLSTFSEESFWQTHYKDNYAGTTNQVHNNQVGLLTHI
jgi:hypothetical protein